MDCGGAKEVIICEIHINIASPAHHLVFPVQIRRSEKEESGTKEGKEEEQGHATKEYSKTRKVVVLSVLGTYSTHPSGCGAS